MRRHNAMPVVAQPSAKKAATTCHSRAVLSSTTLSVGSAVGTVAVCGELIDSGELTPDALAKAVIVIAGSLAISVFWVLVLNQGISMAGKL